MSNDADAQGRPLERIVMPWTTAHGSQLEFPTALWAKLARANKPKREDVMDALQGAQRMYTEAVELSNRVVELENEVLRLKHENEFMLRLLNDRDSA